MKSRVTLLVSLLSFFVQAAACGNGGGGSDDVADTAETIDVTPADTADPTETVADSDDLDTAPADTVDATDPPVDSADDTTTATADDADADADAEVAPGPACDAAPNVARRDALLAAQPTLGVRSKAVISADVSWPTLAPDGVGTCAVTLGFRDLDGDGALTPYEDWTRPASVRAADLAARMTRDEKAGLLVHPTLHDHPTSAAYEASPELQALLVRHVRFGLVADRTSPLVSRARWANDVQARCEATPLGVPFVLSLEPAHSRGAGREPLPSFTRWPLELGFGATRDPALVEAYGGFVADEYRAIGVRMALSPAADLATDPRWHRAPFSFGEDADQVAELVAAYVRGLQGAGDPGALVPSPLAVAAVVGHFPGAGAGKDGADDRLAQGRFLAYPGGAADAHLAPFAAAIDAGVAAVMPAYGIPEAGAWSALGGALDGATIEQVGAPFHRGLLTDALRGTMGFGGLVLAPWGAVADPGVDPLGAPWGLEERTRDERIVAAISAGVDQIGGLDDATPILVAVAGGALTDAQLDLAATRALTVTFALGLFEDPYVDPAQVTQRVGADAARFAARGAMVASAVLLVNVHKPAGWLDGSGDGTQVGDPGNAGNGTRRVLPAPPGTPYMGAASFYVLGDVDYDEVQSWATGFGDMTNDHTVIGGVPVSTEAERIARSDYVIVRLAAPFTADPDSGPLACALPPLTYASNDDTALLEPLAIARAAIDADPTSRTQLVVVVDAARAPVIDELLAFAPSALYLVWGPSDLEVFHVMFGIDAGAGVLPVGLPASDAAAAAQLGDVAGDGAASGFTCGTGLVTSSFTVH